MKRYFAAITCLAIAMFVGCSDKGKEGASGKGTGKGIEVEWPGGHVKIDPEKGVDVQAPGVDVQVDKNKKVGVEAPGVGVKVDQATSKDE